MVMQKGRIISAIQVLWSVLLVVIGALLSGLQVELLKWHPFLVNYEMFENFKAT